MTNAEWKQFNNRLIGGIAVAIEKPRFSVDVENDSRPEYYCVK